MADRRELYCNPNGDAWFLGRDPSDARAVVIHEPKRPSGAHTCCIELSAFLYPGAAGPEHKALLRLIGTLVDTPPYSSRES